MDGNGRWARKRGLPRIVGHKKGADALKNIVTLCKDVGIKYLTVYSFSSENWQRPQDEVSELMDLFVEVLQRELESLHKNGIKIVLLGQREIIPLRILKIFEISEEKTKDNKELLLNVAFSYGSRQEIANAAKKMCMEYKNKEFSSEENIEKIFSKFLYTSDCPDPDLLIRTSGEYRISNFLLWQIAYTELYFTKTLWPDFNKKNFYKAIYDYQRRNRRFGKL
ncbi:MAG: isoprenyl transferase [Actinobacteria bacterium]|nr:isoprenyl transferase [Actinomycetota bacterium]MCG2789977.1 isoprenyl transferase [Actinomycetes bacterium]